MATPAPPPERRKLPILLAIGNRPDSDLAAATGARLDANYLARTIPVAPAKSVAIELLFWASSPLLLSLLLPLLDLESLQLQKTVCKPDQKRGCIIIIVIAAYQRLAS